MKGIFILLFILAGLACGIPEEKYYKDIKQLTKELSDTKDYYNNRVLKLKEKVNLFKKLLEDMKGDLSAKYYTCSKRLDHYLERDRKFKDVVKKIMGKLKLMVKQGKLEVKIWRGQLVVQMNQKILFDPGQNDLKKEGRETLDELTNLLMDLKDKHFQVAGHTDDTPIYSYRYPSNWDLSVSRAVTVVRYMQKLGFPADKLSATGYGEFAPAASNETEEGKTLNRRIDIVLVPNWEEITSTLTK